MTPAHMVVTWDTDAIPLALILGGALAVIGGALAMARRYPLAVWAGTAMSVAGWSMFGAQEFVSRNWPLAGSAAALLAWSVVRLWSLRETVR